MTSSVSSGQVLQLYRNLLRYGQKLRLTDQTYFSKRIKQEFRSHKDLQSKEQITFLYKKGQSLLEKKRVV